MVVVVGGVTGPETASGKLLGIVVCSAVGFLGFLRPAVRSWRRWRREHVRVKLQ